MLLMLFLKGFLRRKHVTSIHYELFTLLVAILTCLDLEPIN